MNFFNCLANDWADITDLSSSGRRILSYLLVLQRSAFVSFAVFFHRYRSLSVIQTRDRTKVNGSTVLAGQFESWVSTLEHVCDLQEIICVAIN